MGILRFGFRSEILSLCTNVTVCYPTGRLTAFEPVEHISPDGVPPAPPKNRYVPGMKFQTVYMLHGGGDDDSIPYRLTRLEQYAEDNQVMLVTPMVNDSLYMNTTYGFRYLDFVTQELPVVIRSLFASSEKREDNFIMGFAMGGNGALGLGLMRPDLYSAVVDLSGGVGVTVDRDEYVRSLSWEFDRVRNTLEGKDTFVGSQHDLRAFAEKNIADGVELPKIFIGVCEKDFIRDRVHEDAVILKGLGYDVTYDEPKGMKHDFDFWDMYFKKALDEWLPLRRAPIYPEK